MRNDYSLIENALLVTNPPIKGEIEYVNVPDIKGIISKVYPEARFNKIINCSISDEKDAKKTISEIKKLYNQSFHWYVHKNSTPSNLESLLLDNRFKHNYTLKFLTLDSKENFNHDYTPHKELKIEVKEIENIELYFDYFSKLFNFKVDEQMKSNFINRYDHNPEIRERRYFAFIDKEPVGIAYKTKIPFYFDKNKRSYHLLHWANVKKEYRGKGLYSALLSKRIIDAKSENGIVITIANNDTSYPILIEKGFKEESTIEMFGYTK